MPKFATAFVVGAALLAGLTGCATGTSGSGLRDTVQATNRAAANLDKSLQASVDKLSETTANLTSRVEEYEAQIGEMRAISEQHQASLDRVQFGLDELAATLYQRLNLTPPTSHGFRMPGPPAEGLGEEGTAAAPPAEPEFPPVPPPPPAEGSAVFSPLAAGAPN